jgi:hypothetical protein
MSTRDKVLLVVTALAAACSILYLQGKFEGADVRNGVAIAQSYKAPSGRSIPDVLEKKHPGAPIDWKGVEESSCFQHVRVDAIVSPKGAATADYAFTIDLNGPSIHPANPLGEEALGALDAK